MLNSQFCQYSKHSCTRVVVTGMELEEAPPPDWDPFNWMDAAHVSRPAETPKAKDRKRRFKENTPSPVPLLPHWHAVTDRKDALDRRHANQQRALNDQVRLAQQTQQALRCGIDLALVVE